MAQGVKGSHGAGKQGVLDQLGMARGYFFWDGTILMNDIKDDIYIYIEIKQICHTFDTNFGKDMFKI